MKHYWYSFLPIHPGSDFLYFVKYVPVFHMLPDGICLEFILNIAPVRDRSYDIITICNISEGIVQWPLWNIIACIELLGMRLCTMYSLKFMLWLYLSIGVKELCTCRWECSDVVILLMSYEKCSVILITSVTKFEVQKVIRSPRMQ